jgi:hypothetical protein
MEGTVLTLITEAEESLRKRHLISLMTVAATSGFILISRSFSDPFDHNHSFWPPCRRLDLAYFS